MPSIIVPIFAGVLSIKCDMRDSCNIKLLVGRVD